MKNKPFKKRVFFRLIGQLPKLYQTYNFEQPEQRAEFVRFYYDVLRYIDDVVDGDTATTDGKLIEKAAAQDFVNRLKTEQFSSEDEGIRVVLEYCHELADQIGLEGFKNKNLQLLDSLEFDLERRGDITDDKIILSSDQEIQQRYFMNFIDPCFGLMAQTVDQPTMTEPMREIGRASRRYYNLEDLFEDISRGLINVSREDASKFGLDEDSFLGLAQWLLKHPEMIKQQKKLSVANAGIRNIMGEGLTEWTRQEIATGGDNLRVWQNASNINSLGTAALDLIILKQHPLDTLFHFAYGSSASRFYREVGANDSLKWYNVLMSAVPAQNFTPDELSHMREAGKILASIFADLRGRIHAGVTGKELDAWVAKEIKARGALATYQTPEVDFPGAICISVNDAIVHSVPTGEPLAKGDMVGFDLVIEVGGMKADSAFTVCVDEEPRGAKKLLLTTTERALYAGIDAIHGAVKIGDISAAVEAVLNKAKLGVVRNLVGHGIGRKMHETPDVPNYGQRGSGVLVPVGNAIAIEPMATLGDWKIKQDDDGWTIRTADGSLSAHFEHTVLITENGCEIITQLWID